MHGIYSGNKCNFSSSSNLYKPAGIINISSGYQPLNKTNGEYTSKPTITNTSVIMGLTYSNNASFEKITNTSTGAQRIDYQKILLLLYYPYVKFIQIKMMIQRFI